MWYINCIFIKENKKKYKYNVIFQIKNEKNVNKINCRIWDIKLPVIRRKCQPDKMKKMKK